MTPMPEPSCKGCGGAIDPDTTLGCLGYCLACGEATQRAYLADKQRREWEDPDA